MTQFIQLRTSATSQKLKSFEQDFLTSIQDKIEMYIIDQNTIQGGLKIGQAQTQQCLRALRSNMKFNYKQIQDQSFMRDLNPRVRY